MKHSVFLALIFGTSSLVAEEIPRGPQLPAILTGFKDIDYTESPAEIRKLSAGIGEPVQAPGEECTESTEVFTILGTVFSGEYDFQRDKFYGWGFHAFNLEREKATALVNALVPAIEERFGPSLLHVSLPYEGDGPRDGVSSTFQWKVGGKSLSLGFSHSYQGFSVSIGSQHPMGESTDLLHLVKAEDPLKAEILKSDGTRFQSALIESPTNREVLFVLRELARRGVTGTLSNRPLLPPDYGQEIAAFGASSQGRDSFDLNGIRVKFPVSIERTLPNGSKVTEVHRGMRSIFPEGLSFEGKAVDLKVLEDWNTEVPKSF